MRTLIINQCNINISYQPSTLVLGFFDAPKSYHEERICKINRS